ncbi:MAG: peptidoglycan-binding domain-containing protein, partial [Alphaproteobacteria bacterium]
LTPVAAKYKTTTERVLVRAGYTTWKKGRGPIERLDAGTGEIMCLVEVPPQYRTVTKRVQVAPGSSRESIRPAVYKNVTRRVVDRPASTRTVSIPAKYGTVTVNKVVTPASERRIAIPARYSTVTKKTVVTEERLEWREILCETNTNGDVVQRLQRALKAKGHNPGPIDGVYGSQTRAAVSSYQKKAGLPTGGLTIKTLNSLGVSLGRSA